MMRVFCMRAPQTYDDIMRRDTRRTEAILLSIVGLVYRSVVGKVSGVGKGIGPPRAGKWGLRPFRNSKEIQNVPVLSPPACYSACRTFKIDDRRTHPREATQIPGRSSPAGRSPAAHR